jgi:hypothetical protein
MFTGGGLAAGAAGAALVAGGTSDPPPNVMRSLPLQAASNDAQTMAGKEATRKAMASDMQNCERFVMVSRMLPPCQGGAPAALAGVAAPLDRIFTVCPGGSLKTA